MKSDSKNIGAAILDFEWRENVKCVLAKLWVWGHVYTKLHWCTIARIYNGLLHNLCIKHSKVKKLPKANRKMCSSCYQVMHCQRLPSLQVFLIYHVYCTPSHVSYVYHAILWFQPHLCTGLVYGTLWRGPNLFFKYFPFWAWLIIAP